jgi:hypothetical protein
MFGCVGMCMSVCACVGMCVCDYVCVCMYVCVFECMYISVSFAF